MRFGGNFDRGSLDESFEALREQARRAAEIRDALASVVGSASGPDGTVTAYVGATGLKDLVLDPKAMRKPSMDLSAEIVEVTTLARERYEELQAQTAADLGATPPPSPEATAAAIERMQSIVQSEHGDIQSLFQRFRDEAGGDR